MVHGDLLILYWNMIYTPFLHIVYVYKISRSPWAIEQKIYAVCIKTQKLRRRRRTSRQTCWAPGCWWGRRPGSGWSRCWRGWRAARRRSSWGSRWRAGRGRGAGRAGSRTWLWCGRAPSRSRARWSGGRSCGRPGCRRPHRAARRLTASRPRFRRMYTCRWVSRWRENRSLQHSFSSAWKFHLFSDSYQN